LRPNWDMDLTIDWEDRKKLPKNWALVYADKLYFSFTINNSFTYIQPFFTIRLCTWATFHKELPKLLSP
jgi:hypothetical protein